MSKPNVRDIASRWTKTLVRELNPKLFGSTHVLNSGEWKIGTIVIDGQKYVDMRGYPFADRFKDVTLHGVDFSSCKFVEPAGFARVTATSCRFIGGAINGSINGSFTNCRFDECEFIRSIGWPDTQFVRCSFDNANFRRGRFDDSVFKDCSFRACKFNRTEFVKCRFDACDFTDAEFKEAMIGHCSMTRVRNNFLYHNTEDWSEQISFVANPDYQTIYFGETSVGATTFSVEK